MRMAIVHDQLLIKGGAERVFLAMADTFPNADLYTLAYNPKSTYKHFAPMKVRTSFMNPIVRNNALFRYLYPLNIIAMKALNLSDYDVVLTSSATVAKFVKVTQGDHICFCYFPTRAIWHGERYFSSSLIDRLKKTAIQYLKKIDYAAAQDVTQFLAQSTTTAEAIKKYYNRSSFIIPSPIDLERFERIKKVTRGDAYLIVSRLEVWKRVDYAIDAFNKLGLKLRIVGEGADQERLRAMAKSNITFVGAVSDEEMVREYSAAKAVIFTPELEYGLVPIEANACGTPVIAYGVGGVCETMIPWRDGQDNKAATALFFDKQTDEAVIQAVRKFESLTFDQAALSKNVQKYSIASFKAALYEFIKKRYE